jgi:hypothetical protein
MKKMYLVHLIDGGYDSIFCLMTEEEYDQVKDCESEIFESFFGAEEEKGACGDRVFSDYEEIFAYCKTHNIELVGGTTLPQW